MKNAHTIEDLRRAAKRRLPRVVFDYIDGGSDGEVTMRENCTVFDRVRFRPRNAAAMGTVQPARDRARHDDRSAILARAGRQQPTLLSARRVRRGEAGRKSRHRLHLVDALRLPARRGKDLDQRAGVVSALSSGRTRGRARRDPPGARRRILRARRHDRHRGGRAEGARSTQRRPRTREWRTAADAAARVADARAPRVDG